MMSLTVELNFKVLKIYNLCMIKKMGIDNWAIKQAKISLERYYNDKLDTCV